MPQFSAVLVFIDAEIKYFVVVRLSFSCNGLFESTDTNRLQKVMKFYDCLLIDILGIIFKCTLDTKSVRCMYGIHYTRVFCKTCIYTIF